MSTSTEPVVKRATKRRKKSNWFSRLFGFFEGKGAYKRTQARLSVSAGHSGQQVITSLENGHSYLCGRFVCETLGEQRARVMANPLLEAQLGKQNGLILDIEVGDVSRKHALAVNKHATFQVASQFNCLEFIKPTVVPEDGITVYFRDRTQGPACSIACGPATAFRNYFAPVPTSGRSGGMQVGQTAGCMIDNLHTFGRKVGNRRGCMFRMEGGYTLAKSAGLSELNAVLEPLSGTPAENGYRDTIRVGVHADVQVTSQQWGSKRVGGPLLEEADNNGAPNPNPNPLLEEADREAFAHVHTVTQVFSSAVACDYNKGTRTDEWRPLARLVLEAAYEACLLAALDAAVRHPASKGARHVYLTMLGGGVFGNPNSWILAAIERTVELFRHYDLRVHIISYSADVDPDIAACVARWKKRHRARRSKAAKKNK